MTASLKSRVLSGGLWALAGRILTMAANLVATALLARLLAVEMFGIYGLVLSLVTVGAATAPLGVQFAAVRLVATAMATDRRDEAHGTVVAVLRYAILGNVVVSALLLLGGAAWLGILWDAAALGRSALGIVCWLVLTSLQIVLAEVFRGFQDLRLATLCGGVITWTGTVVLLGLTWIARGAITLDQVIGIAVAAAAGNAVFALILLRGKLRALGPPAPVPAATVLGVALPLWINGITANVQGQVDLWVVASYVPKADVAVYYLAVRLVAMVTMWLLLVNTIVPPFIAELSARGERKRLESVLRRTATVAGIPAFGVLLAFLLAGGPILALVGGEEYRAGALALAILSVGQLVNVVGAPASITLAMTGHQRVLMWITLGSSTATVLATWWAASAFGVLGVACAAALGQIWLVLATWIATRRCTGMWTHAGPVRWAELRELLP